MRLSHPIAFITGLSCGLLGFLTAFDVSHQSSRAIAFEIDLGDLLRHTQRSRLVENTRELIEQGQDYYQNGQYDLAIDAYLQAYEKAQEFNPESSENSWRATFIVDSLAGLGDVYLAQEQFSLAIDTFSRAIEEGSLIYTSPDTMSAYGASWESLNNVRWKLGVAYFVTGQFDRAEMIFTSFVRFYENSVGSALNVFGVSSAAIDRWRTTGFTTPTPGYDYLQRIMIAHGDPIKALEIAERSRSRVLLNYLIDDALTEAPSLTVENMHQIAQDTQATLVFYSNVSDNELYIWVIPPKGIVTFRVVDLTQQELLTTGLEEAVSGLLRSVENASDAEETQGESRSVEQDPDTATANQDNSKGSNPELQSRYQRRLNQEYQRFIAPIEDALPSEPDARIIIVPDQELFLVPFAALQDANGRYLIERYEISYTSSLQLLAENQRMARSREANERHTIIVSNPSPMPDNLSALPDADIEARAIAGVQPNVSLFSGEYATEEVIKPILESAHVLHFATHGFYDEERVTNGWIAFAPSDEEDGLLTVREIFEFNLMADLVVLSACTTGRGRITGDGVLGLTRAFIRAGASSVVSSLWSVADDSTSFFMAEFHKQLIDHNATKSAALRTAMLNTMQEYPHPRDWSAFVLIGNPD